MTTISDHDSLLMERYARGDAAAFDALFERYERRAFGFFLRRSRSPERAADLLQELFLRIHRFRAGFDGRYRFSPWFFALARNVWHDELRRLHRLREDFLDDMPSEPDSLRNVSFEAQAGAREQVAQLLGVLAPAQCAVLVGAAVEGLTYPELAARLGGSVPALRQAASRALRRLRAAGGEAG